MREGACCCLSLGINPIANRPALHEDDRMMAVLACDSCGQSEHVASVAAARDQFKAHGGQVVAFIDDEVAIIADNVIHFTIAHKALNQGDVDAAGRASLTAADRTDVAFLDCDKAAVLSAILTYDVCCLLATRRQYLDMRFAAG